MTIELTQTVTEKKQVNIPVPCFWKDEVNETLEELGYKPSYVAVLDDQTAVRIFRSQDFTSIIHGSIQNLNAELVKAQEKWMLCSEEEFFQVYNDTLESIRLKPELV